MSEPFNKRLERLRRERDLTAKDMARLISVPESTYREWEYGRGLKGPPYQAISQVLAISVTELVTGDTPHWQKLLDDLGEIEKSIAELKAKLGSLI